MTSPMARRLTALAATIMVARIIASAPLLLTSGVIREAGLIVAGSDARLSWRYLCGAS